MPSKVYVEAADGDFRAMPAAGAGHTVLKWVTSFPGNPARGLPTVSGVVLLSDAATGGLRALLDAGAVTALRTGAAAVLAAETLSVEAASPAAVIGCGVNGRAVARTFLARGRDVLLWDARPEQAAAAAVEIGEGSSVAREAEARSTGVVVTVTPGHEPVFQDGTSIQASTSASWARTDPAKRRSPTVSWRGPGSSAMSGSRRVTMATSATLSRRGRSGARTSPSLATS